jgi:hypothetical protein
MRQPKNGVKHGIGLANFQCNSEYGIGITNIQENGQPRQCRMKAVVALA